MLVPRRKGKEREGIEMVEVPQERVPVDRVKQDIAMAKWRVSFQAYPADDRNGS
jgi:hypothetical protein